MHALATVLGLAVLVFLELSVQQKSTQRDAHIGFSAGPPWLWTGHCPDQRSSSA